LSYPHHKFNPFKIPAASRSLRVALALNRISQAGLDPQFRGNSFNTDAPVHQKYVISAFVALICCHSRIFYYKLQALK